MRRRILSWAAVLALSTGACGGGEAEGSAMEEASDRPERSSRSWPSTRRSGSPPTSAALSERERRMIPLLIEAAQEMDTIFWQQVYPARDSLLPTVRDSATRAYVAAQLRPLGPARRQRAVRARRGPPPAGRGVLSGRHDQGGVRLRGEGRVRRRRGAPEPLHHGAARLRRPARWPCPTTRPSPGPPGAPRPSCARPPRWPTMPGSSSIWSCGPARSRPTTTGPATSPGWT